MNAEKIGLNRWFIKIYQILKFAGIQVNQGRVIV